jgi:hypothetical protein
VPRDKKGKIAMTRKVKDAFMKHISMIILLTLIMAGNTFAYDWLTFMAKNPSEPDIIRLFGKPSKAGTLYNQIDYETFTKVNKLDYYMLEYDKPLHSHSSIYQSPIGIEANVVMVWIARPGSSFADVQGNKPLVNGIDFMFSGENRDRAFSTFTFDKSCDNEESSCHLTEKCWQVRISASDQFKNYYYVFAEKYDDNAIYILQCLKTDALVTRCFDDFATLELHKNKAFDPKFIPQWKKECEESKRNIKK